MKIKKVMVGNHKIAFIENRFSDNLNIISSDDNNKGKTIVIQSMMYALGNEPIFPNTFDYKNYYHIVELEINSNIIVSICRKCNSFIIKYKGSLSIFDNLSEFKYFVSKKLFTLPYIIKDNRKKLVDPMLFFQMFFVGQDNKDTSNILLKGYYNKNDFVNMLYSYSGINPFDNSDLEESDIKKSIKKLKKEKRELLKQNKILNSSFAAVKVASKANDRLRFEEKLLEIEKIKKIVIELNSKRNNAISRKYKNEVTLKELRSLNRSLAAGELHCLDCNSSNIGYSTADKSYTFDITSVDIRSQILSSIAEKVEVYQEEIENITKDLNEKQNELRLVLSDDDVTLESLLIIKPDLLKSNDADSELITLDDKIIEFNNLLLINDKSSKADVDKRNALLDNITSSMDEFYKRLEPKSRMIIKDLFSTQHSVYSGCEGPEFYLSKLYSLAKNLNHNFPIIMDYFRDGELSSPKEKLVIELFEIFKNQIIFTATLKDEELGKYDNMNNINHIDYSPHIPHHLLSVEYVSDFLDYCDKFSLNIIPKSNQT